MEPLIPKHAEEPKQEGRKLEDLPKGGFELKDEIKFMQAKIDYNEYYW